MKMTPEIREAIAKEVIEDYTNTLQLKDFAEKHGIGKSTIQRDKKVYYTKWKSIGRRILQDFIEKEVVMIEGILETRMVLSITEDQKLMQIDYIANHAKEIWDAYKRWNTFLTKQS